MTATFTTMARQTTPSDSPLKKVSITAKVAAELAEKLPGFGERMRARRVSSFGTGGTSNAVDAILEMALYLDWYNDPDTFADKLLEFRRTKGRD